MDYTVSTATEGDVTTAYFATEDPDGDNIGSNAVVTGSTDPEHALAPYDAGFIDVNIRGISMQIESLTLNDVDGRVLSAALAAHYAALDGSA